MTASAQPGVVRNAATLMPPRARRGFGGDDLGCARPPVRGRCPGQEPQMATFGITHYFKGGTKEQYDNTVKVVHPNGGKGLPPGQTYHAAGPTADGFLVVAMWDTKASW